MTVETEHPIGQVGECIEVVDVELELPLGITHEKRLRFDWTTRPSDDFLMMWNRFMEPNSMFVESLDDRGMVVTVRWALMKEAPLQIAARLNRWLAHCENRTWRPSGEHGERLQ